ncbi:hypothetical protein NA56DRAFT_650177 [Hyaloscypha hepaticicola]|uniref:Uncharacterized protein n=1 Tax=Hyaloscypha hepaticicola TaxID=2082293 RepID=A0A2J6PN61_9HELO|nr:hypothetical protein NA56DRAFT_650177 [Hyaloscypha hepaticicola]
MLLNVAQAALEHAGWPTKVLTGRNMFDLGKNTCNFGYWGSSNAVIKSKIATFPHSGSESARFCGQ